METSFLWFGVFSGSFGVRSIVLCKCSGKVLIGYLVTGCKFWGIYFEGKIFVLYYIHRIMLNIIIFNEVKANII